MLGIKIIDKRMKRRWTRRLLFNRGRHVRWTQKESICLAIEHSTIYGYNDDLFYTHDRMPYKNNCRWQRRRGKKESSGRRRRRRRRRKKRAREGIDQEQQLCDACSLVDETVGFLFLFDILLWFCSDNYRQRSLWWHVLPLLPDASVNKGEMR